MSDEEQPTPAQVESFRQDGVVALCGLVGPEVVERLREAVERVIAGAGDDPRRRGFFTRSQLWPEVDKIRDLTHHSPAARTVGTLLGTSRVYLYEDTVMVKEPACDRRTPWHQDKPYYPAGVGEVGTLWLALDTVSADSGAVRYVRGSHRWPQRYTQPATFHESSPDMPDFDGDGYEVVSFDLQPGDCVVHHGMVIHGAGGNRSATQRRRAVAISYFGPEALPDPGYPLVWPGG